MLGSIGGPELFLILLIILVFFGARKIPEIAKGIGEGVREFRKAARDAQNEDDGSAKKTEPTAPKPPESKA
jgi:sec-independent protein translocase protein TatA